MHLFSNLQSFSGKDDKKEVSKDATKEVSKDSGKDAASKDRRNPAAATPPSTPPHPPSRTTDLSPVREEEDRGISLLIYVSKTYHTVLLQALNDERLPVNLRYEQKMKRTIRMTRTKTRKIRTKTVREMELAWFETGIAIPNDERARKKV